MSKHTPGPWKVEVGANFIQVRHVCCVFSVTGGKIDLRRTADARAMNNATLIASAPDLLDTLESIRYLAGLTSVDQDERLAEISRLAKEVIIKSGQRP